MTVKSETNLSRFSPVSSQEQYELKPRNSVKNNLQVYATAFIALFGTNYLPIEGGNGLGIIKVALMGISSLILFSLAFAPSNAMFCGILYLGYQFFIASMHPETFRWSTLLFSCGLVFSYVCFYNLLYIRQVFRIDYFIKVAKGMMLAYFIVCLIQQMFILVGVRYFPLINLTSILNRGIGCNSLSMEPSSFARTMLVFYYAYVKCSEFKRGKGPYKVKELFSGEHKWVTLRFLWMMLTMGSGTAFVCLIAFSFYFVRKNNFMLMIPVLLAGWIVLQSIEFKQLNRAVAVIEATSSLDQKTVIETDGSAAHRIVPLINSLNADFTKFETWFGHGVDYGKNNNTFITLKGTLFDDYGVCFYLIAMLMNFVCAYRFFSLATLFMFMGVGGGAGSNIHYAWFLMMIMTCVKYFYETSFQNHISRRCI